MFFFLYGFFGSVFVSISNLLLINPGLFNIESKVIQFSIFMICQILISFMFYNYYTKGYAHEVSYPLLITMVYGLGILTSLLLNHFLLEDVISKTDLIGLLFISFGITIVLY